VIRVWYSLYDRLLQRRGLEAAFAKVRRAAGAPGIDGQRVTDFEANLGEELDRLVHELRSKTVKRVTIPKPGGGERHLGIPTVRDRVVQQALLDPSPSASEAAGIVEETGSPASASAPTGLPRRLPENAHATLAEFEKSPVQLRHAKWLAGQAGAVRSGDGRNRSPASSHLSYLKQEPYTRPVRTVL